MPIFSDDSQGNGPLYIFDINNGRDIYAAYDDGTEVAAIMSDGFIRTTSGWKAKEAGVGIGDFAANGDNDSETFPLFRAKHDITITDVNLGFDEAVVTDGTNFVTFTLEQTGNSTDIGTLATSSTGFSIHAPRAFTISSTNDTNKLRAGDSLHIRSTMDAGGAGVACTGGAVSIGYTIDQPNPTTGTATDNMFRFINDVDTVPKFSADAIQRDFASIRENGVERLRIDTAGKLHGTAPDQFYYQVCSAGALVTADSASKKTPIWAPHSNIQVVNAYLGASDTVTITDNTNYWKISLTDGTNTLADMYIEGPSSGGTALTKGKFEDMGDISPLHGAITSSEKLSLEYLEAGTGSTINGLTVIICYKKIA